MPADWGRVKLTELRELTEILIDSARAPLSIWIADRW